MTGPLVAVQASDGERGDQLRAVLTEAGLTLVVEADSDVVVLAATLERPTDVDAVAPLLKSGRRVVAVVDTVERPALRRALDMGLLGCVVTARAAIALEPTIRAVACGQLVLPHELFDGSSAPVFSPREKQVLGMVVLGFTNAEIASKLFVAESTVKSHLNSAFAKLGVRSRSEAAARILSAENGLGIGILAISGDQDR